MRSSRTFQFGAFPRTEIPPYIESYNEYAEILNKLTESNAITSPRQIWWKVRPNINLGTVELRICDAQRSLKNVEMIVAISQALIHRLYQDFIENKKALNLNLIFLDDSLWKSARFGFDSIIYDEYDNCFISIKEHIEELLNYISDSLAFFGTQHVIDSVYNVLSNGTEADHQLDIYKKNGMDGLKKYLVNNVDYRI